MWDFFIVVFCVCIVFNSIPSTLKQFVQAQNMTTYMTMKNKQIIDEGPEQYKDTSAIRNLFMAKMRESKTKAN